MKLLGLNETILPHDSTGDGLILGIAVIGNAQKHTKVREKNNKI